jgi:protein-tyrosine phosphatase
MTRIWERLFIGSLADAEKLAAGNPSDITSVVSLSELPVTSKRRDINYLHLPIEDDEPVSVREFDRILDAISENIRWGTVLLHCASGISRAPSMAAAYMNAVGYKHIDAAIAEIQKARPFIHPSNVLLNNLKENLR